MKTIAQISLAFFFCATISLPAYTQKKLSKIDERNQVRIEKSIFEHPFWNITHFDGKLINKGSVLIFDGNVIILLGCNIFNGGTIEVNELNKSIKFILKAAGLTQKDCSNDKELMKREEKLAGILAKINNYESKGKTLILKKDDSVLIVMKKENK